MHATTVGDSLCAFTDMLTAATDVDAIDAHRLEIFAIRRLLLIQPHPSDPLALHARIAALTDRIAAGRALLEAAYGSEGAELEQRTIFDAELVPALQHLVALAPAVPTLNIPDPASTPVAPILAAAASSMPARLEATAACPAARTSAPPRLEEPPRRTALLPEEEWHALEQLKATERRLRSCRESPALALLLESALPEMMELLATSSSKLRKATVPVLSYVTSRLRADGTIALPVVRLAQCCAIDARKHPFASNFALAFVRIAFAEAHGETLAAPASDGAVSRIQRGRRDARKPLPAPDQLAALRALMNGIAERPPSHHDGVAELMGVSLPVLSTSLAEVSAGLASAADVELVLAWLLDELLAPCPPPAPAIAPVVAAGASEGGAGTNAKSAERAAKAREAKAQASAERAALLAEAKADRAYTLLRRGGEVTSTPALPTHATARSEGEAEYCDDAKATDGGGDAASYTRASADACQALFAAPDTDRAALAECARVLSRLLTNLATDDCPKHRRLNPSNPKLQGAVLGVPGAEEVLRAAGFERVAAAEGALLAAHPDAKARAATTLAALQSAQRHHHDSEATNPQSPSARAATVPTLAGAGDDRDGGGGSGGGGDRDVAPTLHAPSEPSAAVARKRAALRFLVGSGDVRALQASSAVAVLLAASCDVDPEVRAQAEGPLRELLQPPTQPAARARAAHANARALSALVLRAPAGSAGRGAARADDGAHAAAVRPRHPPSTATTLRALTVLSASPRALAAEAPLLAETAVRCLGLDRAADVRKAACELATRLVGSAHASELEPSLPALLGALQRLFRSGSGGGVGVASTDVAAVRAAGYETLLALCTRQRAAPLASAVRAIALPADLLSALPTEHSCARGPLFECLMALTTVCSLPDSACDEHGRALSSASATSSHRVIAEALPFAVLMRAAASSVDLVRAVAARWAELCLPPSSASRAAALLLCAAGDHAHITGAAVAALRQTASRAPAGPTQPMGAPPSPPVESWARPPSLCDLVPLLMPSDSAMHAGRAQVRLPRASLAEAVRFARSCLMSDASCSGRELSAYVAAELALPPTNTASTTTATPAIAAHEVSGGASVRSGPLLLLCWLAGTLADESTPPPAAAEVVTTLLLLARAAPTSAPQQMVAESALLRSVLSLAMGRARAAGGDASDWGGASSTWTFRAGGESQRAACELLGDLAAAPGPPQHATELIDELLAVLPIDSATARGAPPGAAAPGAAPLAGALVPPIMAVPFGRAFGATCALGHVCAARLRALRGEPGGTLLGGAQAREAKAEELARAAAISRHLDAVRAAAEASGQLANLVNAARAATGLVDAARAEL